MTDRTIIQVGSTDEKRAFIQFNDSLNTSKIFEESRISLKGGAQISMKANPLILLDEHKKYTQAMPSKFYLPSVFS